MALASLQPAAAQAPDAATRAAAAALMEASGGNAQVIRVLDAIRPLVVKIIVEKGHVDETKAMAAWDDILLPAMKAHADELVAAKAEIYAENFSASEMQAIQAFYATPVGHKLLAKEPVLVTEGASIGRAWGVRVAKEAIEKNRETLQKRGITL